MFVRVYTVHGQRYMKIVRSFRKGRVIRHHHIESLGRFKKAKYERVRKLVWEWKPLERAGIVIEEMQDISGRLQGRGFFYAFRGW
jgi:hypothetical protein